MCTYKYVYVHTSRKVMRFLFPLLFLEYFCMYVWISLKISKNISNINGENFPDMRMSLVVLHSLWMNKSVYLSHTHTHICIKIYNTQLSQKFLVQKKNACWCRFLCVVDIYFLFNQRYFLKDAVIVWGRWWGNTCVQIFSKKAWNCLTCYTCLRLTFPHLRNFV